MRISGKFRLLIVFSLVQGLRNWMELPLSEMGKTMARADIGGKIKNSNVYLLNLTFRLDN